MKVIIEQFTDLGMMKIYHFGDERQKRVFLKEALVPLCQKLIKTPYYITRDWNGGPHYQIIYLLPQTGDAALLNEMRSGVDQAIIAMGHSFSPEAIEKQLELYTKHAQTLGQMEKKEVSTIDGNLHGKLVRSDLNPSYYKQLYNSFRHFALHCRARMQLQPILNTVLLKYDDSGTEKKIVLLKIFQILLLLYPHGEKYGALQYYSHSQGMLALSKQYGVEDAFEQYFNDMYVQLDVDQLDSHLVEDDTLKEAMAVFKDFYQETLDLFNQKGFQEEGFYNLQDQIQQMKTNVSAIESSFHDNLLSSGALEDVASSQEHLVHRSLTNVLYNSLIFLNIDFKQKHFLCYAISRFVSFKYDTSWQQIMKERGFQVYAPIKT